MSYLFTFVVSFITVFLVTPTIRYVALKFYVIDKKNSRKIHKKFITKLGGAAIYLGFLGGLFTVFIFQPQFLKSNFSMLSSLLVGSTLMLFLGIYDDLEGSGASLKLFIQAVISLLIIDRGFILKGVFLPGALNINFGIFSIPLTLFWLMSMTNAINLLDGLDGLAAGVCGIASFFVFLFGMISKDSFISYVALSLSGASLAFLRYNFYPAKIFMGDTGSLFLGLVLGCLAINRPQGTASNNPYFIVTFFVLLLPIIDIIYAVIRRSIRRQSILRSDSSHIHHRYIKHGYTQTQTAISFYLITFAMGVVSLFVFVLK